MKKYICVLWLCMVTPLLAQWNDLVGLNAFTAAAYTNTVGSGGVSTLFFSRVTNDLTYTADMKNWNGFSANFTNETAKTVDKLGFRILQIGTGGSVNVTAKIYADDGAGKPGSLVATFETRNSSTAPSGSYGWWYFTGTPVSLSSTTPYHLVLHFAAYQNADNYIRWLCYYDTGGMVGWHADNPLTSWPSQETFNSQPCIEVWGY